LGFVNFVRRVFGKNVSAINAPFVVINKDTEIKEYNCIEMAIADLEKDHDIPKEKIENIRVSFENLKNKGSIKIRNGEIVE
jgi:hypothetical protein